MDLSIRSKEVADEDRRWLASLHGFGETQPITLDGDLFSEETFPDGRVPSGVFLGQVTETGRYGPYDNSAEDGREDAAGHLLTTLTGVTAGKTVSGALFYRGRVDVAFLPDNSGLDADVVADLPLIRYEGEVA